MDARNMPLFERQYRFNVITQRSPPNYSRPLDQLSPPATPSSADHHGDPITSPSSTLWTWRSASPPLRRKASTKDLTSAAYSDLFVDRYVTGPTPTLAPLPAAYLRPSLLPAFPPQSPHQQRSLSSPSLSSTISTLHSTPAHSPQPCGVAGQGPPSQRSGITTKRKFLALKPSKRLPRQAEQQWCVYAAVIDTGSYDLGSRPAASDPELRAAGNQAEGGGCGNGPVWAAESGNTNRKIGGRSVRFAGLAQSSSGSAEPSSGEDKVSSRESTYTLSKYRFPIPPNYNWTDTFGHSNEPTPPTSPATLHYRGASFDLVNPHASLLVGKHDIETPGEIDGLLDTYFLEDADMSYDNLTGEPSSPSLSASLSSSRRVRRYADPESARFGIMGIPTMPSATTSPHDYEPSAERRSVLLAREASRRTHPVNQREAIIAANLPREDSSIKDSSQRTSSAYPYSTRSKISNPFDLSVSDDDAVEVRQRFTDPIEVVRRYQHPESATERAGSGEPSVYDEGADAEARAFPLDRDTTIDEIVDQYGYQHPSHALHEHAIHKSISDSSLLMGADTYILNRSESSPAHDFESLRNQSFKSQNEQGIQKPSKQSAPQPRYLLPYLTEVTESPTSDQTYGPTDELLKLTPPGAVKGSVSGAKQAEAVPSSMTVRPLTQWVATAARKLDRTLGPVTTRSYNSPRHVDSSIPQSWSNVDMENSRARPVTSAVGLPHTRPVSFDTVASAGANWEDIADDDGPSDIQDDRNRDSFVSHADTSDAGSAYKQDIGQLPLQSLPSLGTVRTGRAVQIDRQYESPEYQLHTSRAQRVKGEPTNNCVKRCATELITASLMQSQLTDLRGLGITPDAQLQQYRDEVELKQLRLQHRAVVQNAADEIGKGMREREPMSDRKKGKQRAYEPDQRFRSIMSKLGLRQAPSFSSSTRGLFGKQTPSLHSEHRFIMDDHFRTSPTSTRLAYSETANAFETVHGELPNTPSSPYGMFEASPLPQPNTNGSADLHRDHIAVEMQRIRACPAMSGQKAPIPFILGNNADSANALEAQDSTLTSHLPNRRLTDAELQDREQNWTMDTPVCGQHNALDMPSHANMEPRLIARAAAGAPDLHVMQKRISERYLSMTAWFPISALVFGLGGFDGRMRAHTRGRVVEMRKQDKFRALAVATPLGILAYAMVAIVVFVLVELSHL
ncbi:hypothetical protein BAUCODRAFT_145746 [Baudoinia panamericana UAMH 10762]|uniref:Uncharacterized protein n=1 Tax=Baudoinia panamericana (strain UAMH 10762) TaxID=717646 RepID=M2N401_BAUPA|nr:uncharacterized protein BAUCODRAFT_145746 [Baudoinia panamericana UAMH 10762]EMC98713.1 hypothetical protein BAUCODRAFT_145746 [Baudoinia panamericana UAMH 10762]